MPEERRAEGLLLTKSVAFNLQLANLGRVVYGPALPIVDGRRRASLALLTVRELAIKAPSVETPVGQTNCPISEIGCW